jgi:hypothetical protein
MEKYMKKLILIPVVLVTLLLILATFVDISSPKKLPDGKNYIDSLNVYKEERFVYTDKPFLVKGNTNYTFSISRDYVDGALFEVIIDLYENEEVINIVSRDTRTLRFDYRTNTFYFSFKTPENVNFIDLRFTDNGPGYEGEELVNVQLEEGTVYTEYEPYSSQTLWDNLWFIIVFIVILSTVILIPISVVIIAKISNRKKLNKKHR